MRMGGDLARDLAVTRVLIGVAHLYINFPNSSTYNQHKLETRKVVYRYMKGSIDTFLECTGTQWQFFKTCMLEFTIFCYVPVLTRFFFER